MRRNCSLIAKGSRLIAVYLDVMMAFVPKVSSAEKAVTVRGAPTGAADDDESFDRHHMVSTQQWARYHRRLGKGSVNARSLNRKLKAGEDHVGRRRAPGKKGVQTSGQRSTEFKGRNSVAPNGREA